jgi:hypothetical protein
MSSHRQRTVVAVLGTALVLLVAGWFDNVLMAAVRRTEGTTFDITQTASALPVGYMLIAAGTLAILVLARRADSRLVDVVYVVVGGFLTLLFTLVWTLAASINGAPPVLPDPLASFIGQAYTTAETGPLNAVAIIGAAMLVVGIADLGLALRRRPTREARVAPATAVGGSMPIAPQDA